jgi:SAM-dependent methyltransferase
MRIKQPREAMLDVLDFDGKRVADIGCGDGSVARIMAARGALVTGIDVSEGAIEKARAAAPVGDETFALASADEMPFEDQSQDIVIFLNSTHHMTADRQIRAVDEAVRVLVPDGLLFFSEPLAEGPRYELNKPFADEANLRASAQQAIHDVPAKGFAVETEFEFTVERRFENFEAFRANVVKDDERRRKFEANEPKLRELFTTLGDKRTDATYFDQPMRVNLFRKRS